MRVRCMSCFPNKSRLTGAVLLGLLTGCNFTPGPAVVEIQPTSPVRADDLRLLMTADAPDLEGDSVSYRYSWFRDGEKVDELTGMDVAADYTAKGEVWEVRVVPSDETGDGPTTFASALIGNTPPELTVAITPLVPESFEPLEALPVGTDVDADEVSFLYTWFRNGEVTEHEEKTLPAAYTMGGEVWMVEVTPFDGDDYGEIVTSSVTISNVPPIAVSLELSPDPAHEGDTIEAVATAYDPDGDPITITIGWMVDGVPVTSGA